MNETLTEIKDHFREVLGELSVSEIMKNHRLIRQAEKIESLFITHTI